MESQVANNRDVSGREFSLDTIDIISPDHYQKNGYPHAEWAYSAQAPAGVLHRSSANGSVLGDHQGVRHQGDQLSAAVVGQRAAARGVRAGRGRHGPPPEALPLKHLLNMDPPQHGEFRSILSQYFTPRSIRAARARGREHNRAIPRRRHGPRGMRFRHRDLVEGSGCGHCGNARVCRARTGQRSSDGPTKSSAAAILNFSAAKMRTKPSRRPAWKCSSTSPTWSRTAASIPATRHQHHLQCKSKRRASARVGTAFLLAAAGGGGQRDHPQCDQRRPARVHRKPRTIHAAQVRSRADQNRRRGNRAMDFAGDPVFAHRHAGYRGARAEDSCRRIGVPVLPVSQSRRGRFRGTVQVRHRPQSESSSRIRHRRAFLSRGESRAAGTRGDLQRRWRNASITRNWRDRSSGCARASSAASSTCRLATSSSPRESVALHAPSQQIETVLSEEGLAVEDHQRDAPMPGAFLRGLVFGDRGFIAIRARARFPNQVSRDPALHDPRHEPDDLRDANRARRQR